jgi:hypothetical protein
MLKERTILICITAASIAIAAISLIMTVYNSCKFRAALECARSLKQIIDLVHNPQKYFDKTIPQLDSTVSREEQANNTLNVAIKCTEDLGAQWDQQTISSMKSVMLNNFKNSNFTSTPNLN